MRWRAEQLPDLAKRVAIVTGANSGIGFHVARELAAHGARVVLACRRPGSATNAADRIRAAAADSDVETAELDLSSISSIRAFADSWDGPLDLLVNNAGVMAPPKPAKTADGFELQFGTNHLGHFVLTGLLLPALLDSEKPSRVVTVASIAHHGGTEEVVDGNAGPGYQPQKTYSNSKLANLLFALQLHRELTARELPVSSVAAHPGVSATGLFHDREGMGASPLIRAAAPVFVKAFTQSAAAGARAVLYAATEADPGSYTGPQRLGETRGPIGPARLSPQAQDERLARRLWHVSEEMTGLRYEWNPRP
ncbi:MAG TPA: oxidoreductase [Jatrophihabitans sp.]|uniref:oxidoreductase n=1 Tax=Jatrophihabitans sp. TaxID=1932789 RepID=UPI002E0D0750|nr:oxidoreductase [Jatrophihabitans sp.]